MTTIRDAIAILISADGKQALREFDKVGKSASKNLGWAEDSAFRMQQQFKKAGVGMVGIAATMGAGLFAAATAAADAELEHQKLANTMKKMPQLAGASTKAFQDQQQSLQQLTVVDDEAIAGLQSMLGQFGMTQAEILKTTPLVVDLSRKMGIDTATAAKAVGKAFGGSAGALAKMGIQLKLSSDPAERLDQILKALSQKAGGFAATEGKTFAGQLQIMRNRLADVEEGIGKGVIPVIEGALRPIELVADAFSSLGEGGQQTVGTVLAITAAITGVTGAVTFVAGQFSTLASGVVVVATKLGIMTAATEAAAVADTELAATATAAAVATTAAGEAASAATPQTAGFAAAAAGLVAPVAAAAGVLGALVVAGNLWDADSLQVSFDDAKVSADALSSAMQSSGRSLKDVAGGIINQAIAKNRDLAWTLKDAGIGFDEYRDAVANGGDAYDGLINKLKEYQKIDGAANNLGQAAIDRLKGDRVAILDVAGAQRDLNNATYAGLTPLELQIKKAGEAADKLYELQHAITASNDAQRNGLRDQLDYADALDSQREKYDAYLKAVKQFGANSPEAARAQRDLTRASLDAKGAYDRARDGLLDAAKAAAHGKDNTSLFKDKLRETLSTLAPGSDLYQWLDGYIQRLDGIPDTVSTTFEVTYRSNGVGRRASGGPVAGGTPYLVGEQGPELFVPNGSGTIVPHNKTFGGSTGIGGNNYTINVQALDAKSAATAVVDALKAYERTRGPVPVRTRAA
jgi:hypothetical protein